jgi:YD repeat-containing protein
VTNPGGQHADFTDDGNGRLSTATDAAGDTYTYGYNGTDTKVTSITDPSGRQTQFTYTTFRNKAAVASVAIAGVPSSAVTYTYSPQTNGQLYVDVTQTKDSASRITRSIHPPARVSSRPTVGRRANSGAPLPWPPSHCP